MNRPKVEFIILKYTACRALWSSKPHGTSNGDVLFTPHIESNEEDITIELQLPVQTCSHQCSNHHIQQQHLQLPASLDHQNSKSTRLGDMSPDILSDFLYSINSAESLRPVQIMSTREEHAPILVPTKSMYCRLRSEIKGSWGMMKRSWGKLFACSTQPPASGSTATRNEATLIYRAYGRKRGSSRLSISVPVEICAT
ncbi:unnamed protein product [Penicillium salamii]|nr:unnamed protein product [Penicillium salamii]